MSWRRLQICLIISDNFWGAIKKTYPAKFTVSSAESSLKYLRAYLSGGCGSALPTASCSRFTPVTFSMCRLKSSRGHPLGFLPFAGVNKASHPTSMYWPCLIQCPSTPGCLRWRTWLRFSHCTSARMVSFLTLSVQLTPTMIR